MDLLTLVWFVVVALLLRRCARALEVCADFCGLVAVNGTVWVPDAPDGLRDSGPDL